MNWRSIFSCLAVVLCISQAEAADARITSSDLAEIRQVIHRQIDAFRRDDAQGAFAPASIVFLELLVMSGEVVQQVQLTDRAGALWVAYFSIQRQSDGSWRMNGCHLVQPARSISA